MTNSAKGGYKKHPWQLYGPDYKAEVTAPKAVEMNGLMEREENMKPFPLFPQSLEITKCGDFTHSHRTTTTSI